MAVLTLLMTVRSGPGAAATIAACVGLIFGAGAVWVQRLEDHQEAAAQAKAGGSNGIGTQGVCAAVPSDRPRPSGVQKGWLGLTRDAVFWEHGPSGSMEPVTIARLEIRTAAVGSRGLFWRRGSLILSTDGGPAVFVTTARFDRLLQGVEHLGFPARRLGTK
jgi:hypothetical protein